MEERLQSKYNVPYSAALFSFLASLAIVLLGIVDVRRGFLFPEYGLANAWVNINPHQLWFLVPGIIGLVISYPFLRGGEAGGEVKEGQLQFLAKVTASAVFGLLAIDTLLFYRGISATRIVEAGRMGIGALGLNPGQLLGKAEVFPLMATPFLLRPFAIMVNYFALVWHATFLAIMFAGLSTVVVPLYLNRLISPRGASTLRSLIGGVTYAIPQPFCSCCAAPIAATIYRTGTPLVSSIAFLLSSPTLNITSLLLAAVLLPLPFAALRILGGCILILSASYLVATLAGRLPTEEAPQPPGRIVGFASRVFNRYCLLFQFEPRHRMAMTPVGLILDWVSSMWRVAKVVIPTLAVGSVVAGAIVTFLPAVFVNNVGGVMLAAGLGTVLMISTWTEIPVAAILAGQGLSGPAAALLVTLPVISLPCLLIFGGSLRSGRVALLMGLATFAFGVIAGLIFL